MIESKMNKNLPPTFRYKIDYEYGVAELFTWRTDQPLTVFKSLASECFGIRKSIGFTTLLSASDWTEREFPFPWTDYGGACHMLLHNGDSIIWNGNWEKLKSEFDD